MDLVELAKALLAPQFVRLASRMAPAEKAEFARWLMVQGQSYIPPDEAPLPGEAAVDAKLGPWLYCPSPWLIKRKIAEASAQPSHIGGDPVDTARDKVNAEHAGANARLAEGGAQ